MTIFSSFSRAASSCAGWTLACMGAVCAWSVLQAIDPLRRAYHLVAQVVLLLAGDRAGDLGGAPSSGDRAFDAEAGQDLLAGEREVLDAGGVGQGAGLGGLG